MATVLGDYGEQSRFHNMISTSGLQHQRSSHSSPHDGHNHAKDPHSASRYRSVSSSRDAPPRRQPSASPRDPPQFSSSTTSSSGSSTRNGGADARCAAQTHTQSKARKSWDTSVAATSDIPREEREGQHHTNGGASRFPSPPSSSSPSISSGSARPQQHAQPASPPSYMTSSSSAHGADRPVTSAASSSTATSGSSAATVVAASQAATGAGAIPSPASDSGARWSSSAGHLEQSAAPTSPPQAQTTIHVRDLAHIQSLARADLLTGNGPGILNDPPLQAMKYEISGMPIGDIIEMVAALLTKITTTNDLQHDALNRNATHLKQAQAANSSGDGAGGSSGDAPHMSPLSSSVLAFHGKNVPAITILSYLSRIHKYCPTTYEVFLSLLVYFDRMTERVNEMVMKSEEARRLSAQHPETARPASIQGVEVDPDTVMGDAESDDSDEMDSDLADDDDDDDDDEEVDDAHVPQSGRQGKKRSSSTSGGGSGAVASTRPRDGSAGGAARANVPPATSTAAAQATYFVVDSFNIHRLIIAGVTCASKFFSDVFYTNSRYAKVGGLPLAELNHLELQFLLLNDFRLAVPVEDLEAYATMLVEFYAREVVAQRSRPVAGME